VKTKPGEDIQPLNSLEFTLPDEWTKHKREAEREAQEEEKQEKAGKKKSTAPKFKLLSKSKYESASMKGLVDVSECMVCCCDTATGCSDECVNRLLFIECIPESCPCAKASKSCRNMVIQRSEFAKTEVFETADNRGWALRVKEDVAEGTMLCEYTGEVIAKEECMNRLRLTAARGEHDVYIASLDSEHFLDAKYMGGVARFANHSCGPNSQMQKWNVRGETRVVLAAGRDLFAGEEITYNYAMDTVGGSITRQRCLCGAPACAGYIGGRVQTNKTLGWFARAWQRLGFPPQVVSPIIDIDLLLTARGSSKVEAKAIEATAEVVDITMDAEAAAEAVPSELAQEQRRGRKRAKTTFFEAGAASGSAPLSSKASGKGLCGRGKGGRFQGYQQLPVDLTTGQHMHADTPSKYLVYKSDKTFGATAIESKGDEATAAGAKDEAGGATPTKQQRAQKMKALQRQINKVPIVGVQVLYDDEKPRSGYAKVRKDLNRSDGGDDEAEEQPAQAPEEQAGKPAKKPKGRGRPKAAVAASSVAAAPGAAVAQAVAQAGSRPRVYLAMKRSMVDIPMTGVIVLEGDAAAVPRGYIKLRQRLNPQHGEDGEEDENDEALKGVPPLYLAYRLGINGCIASSPADAAAAAADPAVPTPTAVTCGVAELHTLLAESVEVGVPEHAPALRHVREKVLIGERINEAVDKLLTIEPQGSSFVVRSREAAELVLRRAQEEAPGLRIDSVSMLRQMLQRVEHTNAMVSKFVAQQQPEKESKPTADSNATMADATAAVAAIDPASLTFDPELPLLPEEMVSSLQPPTDPRPQLQHVVEWLQAADECRPFEVKGTESLRAMVAAADGWVAEAQRVILGGSPKGASGDPDDGALEAALEELLFLRWGPRALSAAQAARARRRLLCSLTAAQTAASSAAGGLQQVKRTDAERAPTPLAATPSAGADVTHSPLDTSGKRKASPLKREREGDGGVEAAGKAKKGRGSAGGRGRGQVGRGGGRGKKRGNGAAGSNSGDGDGVQSWVALQATGRYSLLEPSIPGNAPIVPHTDEQLELLRKASIECSTCPAVCSFGALGIDAGDNTAAIAALRKSSTSGTASSFCCPSCLHLLGLPSSLALPSFPPKPSTAKIDAPTADTTAKGEVEVEVEAHSGALTGAPSLSALHALLVSASKLPVTGLEAVDLVEFLVAGVESWQKRAAAAVEAYSAEARAHLPSTAMSRFAAAAHVQHFSMLLVERACLEVAHGTDSVENRVKTALWLMVSSNIPAVMREMFTLGGVMHEGELALGGAIGDGADDGMASALKVWGASEWNGEAWYRAKNNETPVQVAQRAGVAVARLLELNSSFCPGLRPSAKLRPNTLLWVSSS
jgi:hypothetical protein